MPSSSAARSRQSYALEYAKMEPPVDSTIPATATCALTSFMSRETTALDYLIGRPGRLERTISSCACKPCSCKLALQIYAGSTVGTFGSGKAQWEPLVRHTILAISSELGPKSTP